MARCIRPGAQATVVAEKDASCDEGRHSEGSTQRECEGRSVGVHTCRCGEQCEWFVVGMGRGRAVAPLKPPTREGSRRRMCPERSEPLSGSQSDPTRVIGRRGAGDVHCGRTSISSRVLRCRSFLRHDQELICAQYSSARRGACLDLAEGRVTRRIGSWADMAGEWGRS